MPRPQGLDLTPNPANAAAPVAPFTHRRSATPITAAAPHALVVKATGQVVQRALRPFTGTFNGSTHEQKPIASVTTPGGADPRRLKVVDGKLAAMPQAEVDAVDLVELPAQKVAKKKCVDDLMAERQRVINLVMLTDTTARDAELAAAASKAATAHNAIDGAADKAAVEAVDLNA